MSNIRKYIDLIEAFSDAQKKKEDQKKKRIMNLGFQTITYGKGHIEPKKWYHGTDAENISAFDLKKCGSQSKCHHSVSSIFFTDDDFRAAEYGKNIIPVYIRGRFMIVDGTNFRSYEDYDSYLLKAKTEKFHPYQNHPEISYDYDGVIFQNVSDTANGKNRHIMNVLALFDPKMARRTTAKFKNIHNNNLDD